MSKKGSQEWLIKIGFEADHADRLSGTFERWTHKRTGTTALRQPYMNDAQWLEHKIAKGEEAKKLAANLPSETEYKLPTDAEIAERCKGMYNSVCFRADCKNGSAIWYNRETQKYYCEECAEKINASWQQTVMHNRLRDTPYHINPHPLCRKVADNEWL